MKGKRKRSPENHRVLLLHAVLIKRGKCGPQSTEHLGNPLKEVNANIVLACR